MDNLQQILEEYILDKENPQKNYKLAVTYESMGQTASAISFFLRASERTQDKTLSYECLLKIGLCFERQNNRNNSALCSFKQALMLLPNRPEAYFLVARNYQRNNLHVDAYTNSVFGLMQADIKVKPLAGHVEYPGEYALLFQKAVSAWWWGRENESRILFREIADNYHAVLDEPHFNAVKNNLHNLGIGPEWVTHKHYEPWKHNRLRAKFNGSEKMQYSHGQAYQDLFVLSMLNGKTDGTYLEIGSAGPYYGNNTALLEETYGWSGVGIDFDEKFVKEYTAARKNPVLKQNALEVDYIKVLSWLAVDGVVDYLQLDCEPSSITYEIMTKIPFDKFKFRVITYEHDHYLDMTKSYRKKSRDYLSALGYVLVVPDVSTDGHSSFEDWWVHKDLVDSGIIEKMQIKAGKITDIEKYMFPAVPYMADFDWGEIADNDWFHGVVYNEIFVDNVYERFVSVDEGDVVVDVGTSVGPFIKKILNKKPGMVYGFEPNESIWNTAVKNVSGDNIKIYNAGIAPKNATTLGGMFDKDVIEIQDVQKKANCITFSQFIKDNNIEKIDFLKTDCEGGEYDILNEENFDWIIKNVRKISGEFHLCTPEQKLQFRKFRDTYLRHFRKYKVESVDYVDIQWDMWNDSFIEFYYAINIHIDNTEPVEFEHWRATDFPTMEITTNIAAKGCVVDCTFCPQRTLEKAYKGTRILSLDDFKLAIDKLPKEVRVTFAGFTEPWLNKHCTDMVEYAHERGHPISVFTTAVGMTVDDVHRLKKIPYAGNPNGGFVLHLPDQERIAKHPLNKNFIKVMEAFHEVQHEIQNFTTMCMSDTVHEKVRHLFPTSYVPQFWDRAGNLSGEGSLKPELDKLRDKYLSVHYSDTPKTCGCVEDLYHNVMLPNGDVSLCCMDYGLENIIGNLFEQEYNDVVPKRHTCFEMCKTCENGIDPPGFKGIPITIVQ
jgi:FkbM family methyltransferase